MRTDEATDQFTYLSRQELFMEITAKADKPTFNPIEITFRLESEEELATLWHQLNFPPEHNTMMQIVLSSTLYNHPPSNNIASDMWREVDKVARKVGFVRTRSY
jgi:hypothetical protein